MAKKKKRTSKTSSPIIITNPDGGGPLHVSKNEIWTPDDISPLSGEITTEEELALMYSRDGFTAWCPDNTKERPPFFASQAGDVMDLPDEDTFLWRWLFTVLAANGITWRPQYQKRGTCVGQGFKLALDTIMAINHLVMSMEWKGRAAVAGVYPGSRVDIAGRPGSWDGSNGSWAADWCTKYGILLLKDLELPDDARDTDERIAVRWTNTREGVPKKWEAIAKERPVDRSLLVTDAREAGKSIQGGNPVVNCSNLIPTGRRDSNGFSRVQRSGGHCTLFWAVRYNPFGLFYMNSWNLWGSGPKFPEDQPDGGVWVNERDANAILRQRDSYALIGPTGFDPLPSDALVL